MAISTYSELKAAMASASSTATWTHRTDLVSQLPNFISLFEAGANGTIQLRDNEIEASLTATVGSSYVEPPADFQEGVALWIAATRKKLAYKIPEKLPYYPSSAAPSCWTQTATSDGTRLRLDRDADQAYGLTLRYHKRFALSDSVTTNALLTKYPNVYLYGSLLTAAPYCRDRELIGMWNDFYTAAKSMLDEAEGRQKRNTTLEVDPALISSGGYDITADA